MDNELNKPSKGNKDTVDKPNSTENEIEYKPCFTCNGFYGPSYEDPICPVCHSFLLRNPPLHNHYQTCLSDDKDDEDSGNDEPDEDIDRSTGLEPAGNEPIVNVARTSDNDLSGVTHIEQFPPEVMILTFSFLDDLSLWAAAKVNRRWREIIMRKVTCGRYWEKIVEQRWPLLQMGGTNCDWFQVYSSLVRSSCCLKCLRHLAFWVLPVEEESYWRHNRLCRELKALEIDPPDGIKAIPLDPMYCHWMASIKGPEGSPYEGGIFFLYIIIPYAYPMTPPIVRFITKIFHPNISRHGDIGIDSILNNWSLALTICKVLISIQSLLTDPVCEICMEPVIGHLYLTNRAKYDDMARDWTWNYAMTQLLPH
ncbi:PREDICTED: uncharacterized protein LOC108563384 [Nicrophorus vespilloides]|uniref:Uncharacterized protein LOC108563384 n=1 Tax=Nicrophorus vespilloides TaxID=110193 RepID=A0ABM1MSI2_NICVS|nr:PREDICTED: uncharacterized protein LOC108563384 [Nicrophorus vespilloides]